MKIGLKIIFLIFKYLIFKKNNFFQKLSLLKKLYL